MGRIANNRTNIANNRTRIAKDLEVIAKDTEGIAKDALKGSLKVRTYDKGGVKRVHR